MADKKRVSDLVDHFFRNEFGKAVAYLTGKFGTAHLEEAEDAVQEALIKAMKSWSLGQVPDRPAAWIIRVAHNRFIDQLRRKQKVFYSTQVPETVYEETLPSEELFTDEMIKMIFACCNPGLSVEHQLILTLKIPGGLSVREISSALLKKEETVAKAYTRAKRKFREENLKLEFPSTEAIQSRLQIVLRIIYLIFNEGYKSTEGDQLIRLDLCEEAMRLNHLLLGKPETNNEWTRSLMALMHYHVARFSARTDEDGDLVPLRLQDRSKWDRQHIATGNRYLATITAGNGNEYFLQAAISGIHSAADSYESTDWSSILALYDALYQTNPSPVIALNRIIPFSKVHGAQHALTHLEKQDLEAMKNNHLVPAIKAELYIQLGKKKKARSLLEMAFEMTTNQKEQKFLRKKLDYLANKQDK